MAQPVVGGDRRGGGRRYKRGQVVSDAKDLRIGSSDLCRMFNTPTGFSRGGGKKDGTCRYSDGREFAHKCSVAVKVDVGGGVAKLCGGNHAAQSCKSKI